MQNILAVVLFAPNTNISIFPFSDRSIVVIAAITHTHTSDPNSIENPTIKIGKGLKQINSIERFKITLNTHKAHGNKRWSDALILSDEIC